ncbi:amidohydrolase family protein [Streptomyces sp. NPDC005799]|uniref:amidohydrolase family protein n=1 Tax=Streptomyces sp. NPDC005799 TaxID=3154678 RepID=UPI0033E0ABA0
MPVTVTELTPATGVEIIGLTGNRLVDRGVAENCLAALERRGVVIYREAELDGTTEQVPNKATVLTARQISDDGGGDTEFANTFAAYESLKNSIHVSPFHEEDLGGLADLMGVDRILFGSDYPHPEGLAQPTSYVDSIQGLSESDQAKIMDGNLSRLIPA